MPEVHLPIRVAGLLLLAADLGLVLWLVLRSSPAEWMLDTNFTPFATVRAELAGGTLAGYREIARGVLALAPVGILLPMAGGRPYASPLGSFLRTSGAGLLLATAVEVVQTAVGGKVLNVDDVILAVLGLMLTHVAVVPAGRAAVRRRVEARAPAAPTPAPAPAPTTPA